MSGALPVLMLVVNIRKEMRSLWTNLAFIPRMYHILHYCAAVGFYDYVRED